MKPRTPAVIALPAAALALAACSSATTSTPPAAPAPAATSPAAAAGGQAACSARKAKYSDLLVRDIAGPGTTWQAAEIGGAWSWDATTSTCLDAVAWTIATAGNGSGDCTQVALAASNPGYDVNASPAPSLKGVVGSAGPGC